MTTTTSSSGSSGDENYTNKADLTRLANIKHNRDIGLKVNTKKCKQRDCPLHGKLKCTNQVRSNISWRAYIICGAADCNTKHVVYMIQCRNCGRPDKPNSERFKNHLRKIREQGEVNTLHDHFRKGPCRGVHNITTKVHVLENADNFCQEDWIGIKENGTPMDGQINVSTGTQPHKKWFEIHTL